MPSEAVCANHPNDYALREDYLCAACRDDIDKVYASCEACKFRYVVPKPPKEGIRFMGLCNDCKRLARDSVPLLDDLAY
jgi:hypothetical protein